MQIGIVLPDLPSYSETFFRSKIQGLVANGAKVVIFVGSSKIKPTDLPCRAKRQLKVHTSPFLNLVVVFFTFFKAVLLYSKAVKKFIQLEQQDGSSLFKTVRNLYINYHILSEQGLNWIHFSFATMALGRENVAKALGAKMAVSFRGYDISIYPVKHSGCYNLLWQKVDKVHTISNDLLEIAYSLGLSPNTPTCKITPAINIDYFSSSQYSAKFHTPLRIVTVARLHWKKGLEYTLQALALLKKEGIEFRYTIIGEGDEYERLAFAAYQMGIKDWVTFVGKLPHEKVKNYLAEGDLYIQYSIQEGFCNAVLEAQAMGLLCVVSDAEGLPENVLHEETGWVVPKRNPELLARKIRELSKLPDEVIQTIKNRARQRVEKEFDITQQKKAFLEFYTTS